MVFQKPLNRTFLKQINQTWTSSGMSPGDTAIDAVVTHHSWQQYMHSCASCGRNTCMPSAHHSLSSLKVISASHFRYLVKAGDTYLWQTVSLIKQLLFIQIHNWQLHFKDLYPSSGFSIITFSNLDIISSQREGCRENTLSNFKVPHGHIMDFFFF